MQKKKKYGKIKKYEFSNWGKNKMKKIKNKIITISGEPVSGKSTVVKQLIKKYEELGFNVHVISTGKLFREIIVREYLKMYPDRTDANLADIQTDESFAEKRAKIDEEIDTLIAQKGIEINEQERPNDIYIFDSRLAWHNIPEAYAVRLTIDDRIAGKRVMKDQTRGKEDTYRNLKDAIEQTKKRKLGEIERYKKKYGVDLTNPENYDLIIDTSHSNVEELADIIISGEEAYRNGQEYPKTWASPAHFFSEQKARLTSGDKIMELATIIKKEGYDVCLGIVDIAEHEGAKILLNGNHRICAALSTGRTLIPYEIIAKDNKFTQMIASGIYDDPTLECIYDWAEMMLSYYGGELGKIESLKGLRAKDLIHADKVPKLRKYLDINNSNSDGR